MNFLAGMLFLLSSAGGVSPDLVPDEQDIHAGIPILSAIAKAQAGAWSEYRIEAGPLVITERVTLLRRERDNAILEIDVRFSDRRVTFRMQTKLGKADVVIEDLSIKIGNELAMDVPRSRLGSAPFILLDFVKIPGPERPLVSSARVYSSRRYHRSTGLGSSLDAWLSLSAAPLGLVRLYQRLPATPANHGWTIKMELIDSGVAAPAVASNESRSRRPFDEAILQLVLGGTDEPRKTFPFLQTWLKKERKD